MKNKNFIVVESAYIHHPQIAMIYNLKIYMNIDYKTQLRSIVERHGKERASQYKSYWVPKANEYFKAYEIKENSDLVLTNDIEIRE